LALGFEYRQGANYGSNGGNWVDADYFDIHAAYLATTHFTGAAAYTYAGALSGPGAINASNPKGFGGGLVFSLQYAF
jgi:hypothetical protein